MTLTTQAPAFLPMMQPVLRRGRSFLDREVLPGDENEKRLNALLAAAAERGLDGVVIFGAAHTPENLVYYANYTPTTFHGALVARTGQPPVLFAGKGGARDHPYIRTVSWVADVRYAAQIGPAVAEVADGWGAGRLGVAGLDTSLPHHVRDEVGAALGDRLAGVDDLVVDQSAREIAVLATANTIAGRAAAAAAEAYADGAGRRTALAAADYAARAGNAHDCRITAGTGLGGVAGISEVRDDRGPLTAVIAAEYLGYWGVAAIRLGTEAVDNLAIDRVVARLRPGVDARAAFSNRDASFLVNGIGCGLVEAPSWGVEPDAALRPNDVVSIAHLGESSGALELDVRTVVIDETGARSLA
jgi:hypothetical protein